MNSKELNLTDDQMAILTDLDGANAREILITGDKELYKYLSKLMLANIRIGEVRPTISIIQFLFSKERLRHDHYYS